MTVESVTYINTLDENRPAGGDKISQGDNHIRNIKRSLKETFKNIDGEVRATDEEINYLVGLTGPLTGSIQDLEDLQKEVDLKADKTYVDAQDKVLDDKIEQLATDGAADIINLQGQIDDKADKSYVDGQNASQDAVIGTKADKSYVDTELGKKADKSYVDAQNNAQNTVINTKADKSYVDTELAKKSDKSATYTKAEIDVLIAEAKKGGGMIKVVQQPATAGDFSVQGREQTYGAGVGVGAGITKTLVVPNGTVFCFEYLFGVGGSGGTLRVDIDQIYIDGVRIYPNSQGYIDYTSSGGAVWPGNDKSSIIRVEEKIEIKNMSCYTSSGSLYLAGFFAEA